MMRITRARLYAVALPLAEPFTISGGTMSVRRSLIIELADSEGHRGYGESAPFELPFYSSETFASARSCLVDLLLPAVVSAPLERLDDCRALLAGIARGNRMAKAGVETACWDLCATRERTSLANLVSRRLDELGAAPEWIVRREYIECGVALGIPPGEDIRQLRHWVSEAVNRGYRRLKLKVRPGWDVEPVRAASEEVRRAGSTIPIWVDANGSYELARDRKALEALDRLNLLFIEQPLPEEAWWDSVQLTRKLSTPICLDESLISDTMARQLLEMDGPRIWNIKIQRVGGLEEACRIYARATAGGVALWGGTMPETGVGAQAMLALGGHAGFVYPSDIEPSDRWYAEGSDLVPLRMDGEGRMPVPEARCVPDLRRAVLVAEIGSTSQ